MLVRRHVSREENDVVPTEGERDPFSPFSSFILFSIQFRSVSFRLVWLVVRDSWFEREETDGTRSRGGGVKGVVSMM